MPRRKPRYFEQKTFSDHEKARIFKHAKKIWDLIDDALYTHEQPGDDFRYLTDEQYLQITEAASKINNRGEK